MENHYFAIPNEKMDLGSNHQVKDDGKICGGIGLMPSEAMKRSWY